ncbi:hypothetical protein ACJ2A9_09995 [Anaerobacillus sp. MEB173]|uniref:hypothetical protein n=1 Tax=Anaerobacillus sp. MEB173 TaxID=3383345 RepID=UPI003F8F541A
MERLSATFDQSRFTTDDWFQLEKEQFALSSPDRPQMEKKLSLNFRQTKFPSIESNE